MSEEVKVPVGCVIASGTVLPELASMRSHVDEVLREHRHYDDRMGRLHLQVEDGSRRLDRLERLVETQTTESHSLSKRIDESSHSLSSRIDAIDAKVSTVVNGMDMLGSGMTDMRDAIRSLTSAFADHGVRADEQHYKRIKATRMLWLVMFGIFGILSVLHFGATGATPLQSIMTWIGRMPL